MVDTILLKKDGFYISEYNENLKQTECITINKPFWYYYNHGLVLDEGITFGDVFTQLEPYLDKLEEHFLAETRGWNMKAWFDEIKKERTKETVRFFEIRFNWHVDTFFYFNRKTNQNENSLEKYLSFSAMAKSANGKHGEERYGISFMAIQNLRDLPVVFNKHCEISIWNTETKQNDVFFEFDEGISLRQLIASLFYEITFHGSPETTREDFESLEETIEESEKLDRNDESNFIPFSKIRLEWLEEELKEALFEENYQWAKNVQKEMERIKKEEE